MSNVDQAMTEGPLVLFHRPGSAVLERLVPGAEGPVRFRMHPWEGAAQHLDLVVEGRLETLARLDTPDQPGTLRQATTVEGTARQDHLDRIALALETIENSPLEKVVLSSRLSVRVDGLEFEAIVRQLAAAHPDCFNWLLHHDEIGTGLAPPRTPRGRDTAPLPTACLAGTRMAGNGVAPTPWTDRNATSSNS